MPGGRKSARMMPEETIVVTGTRPAPAPNQGGGVSGGTGHISTLITIEENLFSQDGGDLLSTTVQISVVNGSVVVIIPGYDFPIKVPAEAWNDLTPAQKGAFIKIMTEFFESPRIVHALDHLDAEGVTEVQVYFDTRVQYPDHTQPSEPFKTGEHGRAAWAPVDENNPTDLIAGSKVAITINRAVVGSDWVDFAKTLLHELLHPLYGRGPAVEAELDTIEDQLYTEIFTRASGAPPETTPQDYYDSQTFVGSRFDDNATTGTGNDTLAGLSGNDILNGGAGNDYVMGGVGMDRLTGGTGDNTVAGGLDADTYAPAWGTNIEFVVEMGGVDQMDLSGYSINDVWFYRVGNTLQIVIPNAIERIEIQDQWLAGTKVEQFVFAEGAYASSYIEYLAESDHNTGVPVVCYDESGQMIMCNPYGMPVVFDLDGDGIELVSSRVSRARFDLDLNGARDRVGWVGRDDGILVLDRNGNGRVDSFSEMSFVHDFRGAASDLEGLYAYDSNHDGFLTQADVRFGEFLVWQDSNGNGKSEKHELHRLDDRGIVSIGLERNDIIALRPDEAANQILATSVFTTADGKTGLVGDVALYAELNLPDCGCHSAEPLNTQMDVQIV